MPDAIDDVVAASLPVAYLTAQLTLTLAGFRPGMTVLAPAIGGSVGDATYQIARAQGAGKVISTAGSAAKAARARELGFEDCTSSLRIYAATAAATAPTSVLPTTCGRLASSTT
jgi:NADPH:quinone reductase-like Zn-dependent oxidoreductase